MKRFFSVLFVLILSLTLLAGCGKENPVTVRIAGLKGPTSMGLVQVMEQAAEGKEITRALNAFLGTLSQENRVLFVRRYWYVDTIAEIAQRYHMSETRSKPGFTASGRSCGDIWNRRGLPYDRKRLAHCFQRH